MTRAELAELLRAASYVTGDPEPLVLGSQALLGGYDEGELPLPATASDGADGFARGALFLEQHDLAVGKLVAHREKDLAYVAALLDESLLDVTVLRDRVDHLALERGEDLRRRLHRWLDHWPGAG